MPFLPLLHNASRVFVCEAPAQRKLVLPCQRQLRVTVGALSIPGHAVHGADPKGDAAGGGDGRGILSPAAADETTPTV